MPAIEWAEVVQGEKTELRHFFSYAHRLLRVMSPPEPVIVFTQRAGRRHERILVCEHVWREPLGAISPDSLAREGHLTLGEFRTAWKRRFKTGRWNPLNEVIVFRLRPWVDEDAATFGELLLRRLYLDVVVP